MARAAGWRCRRGAYLALRLANDLVGAAVPDDVLESLTPANFDERILDMAMRQRHGVKVPVAVAELSVRQGMVARLRLLRSRVFLAREQLADAYNLPRSSWLVYAFYPIRVKDMVQRHFSTLVRLHRGDPALTTLAHDTLALQEFFAEE